jgi:type I restriction enzyme S subunit
METSMENIKMERYPEYKDSGVKWIGEIPQEWEIQKGKWLFTKQERPVRKQDEIVTCFRDGQVTLRSNRKTEGFTNALKEHGYQGIRKGDLVIHNMDAFAGAIGVSESDGKSTPVYSACIPRQKNKVNPYYYAYFLRNLAKSGLIESLAKGIRERSTDFRFSDFGVLLLTFPSLPEQTRIAHFLDRKTAQIDQAIAQKERLIELLKERRQILIHNAVTRGLDPNVRMKDSGVEWIGEVPEGWAIKRLKNVCDMLVSNVDKHTKPLEHPVRLCNYVDVYKNEFITSGINFMEATATTDEIRRFVIKIDDVVITKDSEDWLDIGVPALVKYEEKKLICGYHLAILRPNNSTIGGFLHRAILSQYIRTQFSVKANGVTRYGISHGAILGTFIAEPPKEEQQAISSFIDTATQKIATAITCKQSEIEKLKEYKATLINSAVTGKIKV